MSTSPKNLKRRFTAQILIPVIFSIGLLIIAYFVTNPAVRSLLINEREQTVKDMVNSVNNLIDGYNEHVKNGNLTIDKAKEIVT